MAEGLDAMEPAGLDHTSGVMRCRWQLLGGHVHCDVFGPFSGKAGDLTFRAGDEWDHFRRTHPNWQFQEAERQPRCPNCGSALRANRRFHPPCMNGWHDE